MQSTNLSEPVVDAPLSVAGRLQKHASSETTIQPCEFEEMLRQAWLILNSPAREQLQEP